MRKLIIFTLTFLTLCSAGMAAPTEASLIQRAKRTIERADRTLLSIEKSFVAEGSQPPPTVVAGWQKKTQRAEGFLTKASQILDQVSGGSPEQAMLNASRSRLAKVRADVLQKEEGVEAATSLAQGAAGKQAVEDYRLLEASFRGVSGWLRNNQDTPRMMEAYTQAQEAKKVLDQKYASVLGMRTRETFDLTAAANAAEMAQKSVESDTQYMLKNSPAWIEDQLGRARTAATALKKNKAFSGWETSVETYLNQAELRTRKLAAVAPGHPTVLSLQSKVEQTLQEMTSMKTALRSQMIASNSFPADRYTGPDAGAIKAAVRAKWRAKHPQDQIAKVVIATPQWSKFSGTEWVSSSSRWRKYDFDRLDAYVLVPGSGPHNYKFFAQVVRDNLQGGRLDIFAGRPAKPEDDVHVLLPK